MNCDSCKKCIVNEELGIKNMLKCSSNKPTTNYEKLQTLSIDELAEWLNEHGMYDETPWSQWWDKNYCSKCESVICQYEDITDISEPLHFLSSKIECAYCEINNRCRFFPDMQDCPTNIDIIRMWLNEESV